MGTDPPKTRLPLRPKELTVDPTPRRSRLAVFLQPPNLLDCTCEDAHQRMELPFRRSGATQEAPEHDLRSLCLVDGIFDRGQEVRESLVHLFLLEAGSPPDSASGPLRTAELVQEDCHSLRDVQDRIRRICGHSDQKVAGLEILVLQPEVFGTEDEADGSNDFREFCCQLLGRTRDSYEPFLGGRR